MTSIELVWAKMKGDPPWPARIGKPHPKVKQPKNKNYTFVYFLGTNNYAWVSNEDITPYSESSLSYKYLNNLMKKKHARYRRAVKELKNILSQKSNKNSKNVKASASGKKLINPKKENEIFCEKSGSYANISQNEVAEIIKFPKKIGIIGLGAISQGFVSRLLEFEHDVTVWNKRLYKYDLNFLKYVKIAQSPAELILKCDLVFNCDSDSEASKEIIFGRSGILKGIDEATKFGYRNKGYIQITSIGPEISQEFDEIITNKGGRYLEAPIYGNGENAQEGTLIFLAAGDRDLFLECEPCFQAMGKHAYFCSLEVGIGSQMSLLLSSFAGTICVAVAEVLILAQRLCIPENHFLKMLSEVSLQHENLSEMCKKIMEGGFENVIPLKHMQKNLNLNLSVANNFSQTMPVTAATNAVYLRARLSQ